LAKIVLICLRNPAAEPLEAMQRRLNGFLAALRPDNLNPTPPRIATDRQGLWLGVFNPAERSAVHDLSAYAGWLAQPQEPWWPIGAPAPEGSYALLRGSPSAAEALMDYAGSRALWVAKTEEIFIASTSQRAIPYFLGSFEGNIEAQAWMLSSGTLGPTAGWDRRAVRLVPGGSVRLDRARWKLSIAAPTLEFKTDSAPDAVHAGRLRHALHETLSDLQLDRSRWVLPLSGGHDSRALLLLMKDRKQLRAITWGSARSLKRRGNDAWVAQRVAAKLGVSHEYFETDLSDEPLETFMRRYLTAGEGATDGLNAYLDGFRTFSSLFNRGARGVIRGDQCFGLTAGLDPTDARQVYASVGLTRWMDFPQAPDLAALGLAELACPPIPEPLAQRDGESMQGWRDRLYQAFRLPVYMAGQAELKAAYVETANPFLTRALIELTRAQPEHLRRGKALFRQIVAPLDVSVDYAIENAIISPQDFLQTPRVREWLSECLCAQSLRQRFTPQLADYLLAAVAPPVKAGLRVRAGAYGRRARQYARMTLPEAARALVRRTPHQRTFDPRWVALRACIASGMQERLAQDAKAGSRYIRDDHGIPQIVLSRA